MIHAKFPCTYAKFFSDAQLEDENPNLHPTRRALLSYVRLPHRNRLPFRQSRVIAEEDAFGDDEASDSEDLDDEFWDCEHRTKHPSLQVMHDSSRTKSIDRFALLACLDVDTLRISSSIFKDKTTSNQGRDETSNYSASDLSAYTTSESVESSTRLVTSPDLATDTTSVHDLSPDIKCVATHPPTVELESITLSENEDADISSDDDSLFAQYAAILPCDKMPEKYRRCHLKLTKRVSPLSNKSSIPRGCYRIMDFVHSNNFSEVVIAQSMAEDSRKDSESEKGRICCIKIYRNGWPLPMPENTQPELKAEMKAYQRLSEAVGRNRPGLQFLMQLQTLLHDESRSFLIMDVMSYPLFAVIEDLPWALNRVQETKRLVAQMALGIAALHSIGIIHRDLKPDNVLIDYQGNVRITDFGSSKTLDQCTPCLPGGSYAHAYVGTWPYIAPEVLENEAKHKQIPYGIEVDYWSLGCIVFELESVYGEAMFDDRAKFHLWCSLKDDADKQNFLQFGELPPRAFSLICGLVHSDVLKRFGFYEIIHHPYFGKAENSEFYYAQDRALRRTCEGSVESDVSDLCMDDEDEIHLLYM